MGEEHVNGAWKRSAAVEMDGGAGSALEVKDLCVQSCSDAEALGASGKGVYCPAVGSCLLFVLHYLMHNIR